MTSTVILHAGPHKTGTTALQRALTQNAARLADLGILYPQSGRSGDSHAGLAEACRIGDASMMQALAAEAAGWRAVILSSENFSALEGPALASLQGPFPQAEFRVAYTLRGLATLWPAHWAELVKHGQNLDFENYLGRVATRDTTPFESPILPLLQLQRLAQVFGRDAMRIMVYEARSGAGQDIGPAFIDDMLGLGQVAPHFTTQRTNVSPNARETALVRLMNLHVAGRMSYGQKQQLRLALLAEVRDAPPGWLAEFDASLDRARRFMLTSSHPLIAQEQTAVLAQYSDLLLDPPEIYLAPVTTEVPIFGPADLAPPLGKAIAAFIDGLSLA